MFTLPHVQPPQLPLVGSTDTWPVRRLICIGRNYAAHAAEMGADTRSPPFHFLKHAHAATPVSGDPSAPTPLPMPSHTALLHHEVELVVGLQAGGRDLSLEAAAQAVGVVGVGLDLTRRDRQAEAKAKGRPWALAKDFDHAAPIGPLHRADQTALTDTTAITLTVNGELRQEGQLGQMTWNTAELIAAVSQWMALFPGDVLLTGTPAGVGPVRAGDTLVGRIGTQLCAAVRFT